MRINDGIDLAAPHRQTDAPRRAQHPARRPVRLVRVGRDHELPPEVVAQQPDVVDALVRLPVLPDVEADMGQDGLVARMIDVVQALLVVHLVDAEHAEVRPDGDNSPRRRRARGRGRGVLLDSALHEAGRTRPAKLLRHDGGGEVAVEHQQGRPPLLFAVQAPHVGQSTAEGPAVVHLRPVVGEGLSQVQ